jgi:lysophospholipase L1-like esterase
MLLSRGNACKHPSVRTTLLFGAMISAIALLDPSQAIAQASATNRAHHLQYEPAIRAFEARDKTNPPPKDAVLFIGSSRIRLWTNAPAQFPKHQIINRGFGGSHLSDVAVFAERIAIPYQPKVIVLYAGENDIAGGKSAADVFTAFKEFVAKVQRSVPQTPVLFVSLKPSPSREKHLPQFREANRLIREFSATDDRLTYLDVFTPMLDAAGNPRVELFVKDRLHLNGEGYKLWAGIVKPVLDKVAPPR